MKDQDVDHRPNETGPGQEEFAPMKCGIDEIEDDEHDDEINPDNTDEEGDFDGREDDEAAGMTTESPALTEEQKNAAWERDMRAAAEQNGGIVPGWEDDPALEGRQRLVRLPETKMPPPAAIETEKLLNLLIEDCHFLIRELAFNSARLTPNEGARLRFLAAAGTLAEQGGKVGSVIAGLRSGGPVVQEHRQRVIVERVQTIAAPRGEGGTP